MQESTVALHPLHSYQPGGRMGLDEALGLEPPPGSRLRWPGRGAIVFEDVHLRYGPRGHWALRGVSIQLAPGEKVGLCGRTGQRIWQSKFDAALETFASCCQATSRSISVAFQTQYQACRTRSGKMAGSVS